MSSSDLDQATLFGQLQDILTAREMCSCWLTWVKQAEPVSVDRQAMLAERDLLMRRITAERDSGNALVEKIFGAELATQLLRSLWSKEV